MGKVAQKSWSPVFGGENEILLNFTACLPYRDEKSSGIQFRLHPMQWKFPAMWKKTFFFPCNADVFGTCKAHFFKTVQFIQKY